MDDQIHQWIYVIIPIGADPVFCAFCKGCRQYYTEYLDLPLEKRFKFTEGNLPKFGCEPKNEELLPELES